MTGLIVWRKRATSPKPGSNPKNVGEIERPYTSRFGWVTKSAPVNCVRIIHAAPGSAFSIATLGTRFHLPCETLGRSIPVFQSRLVLYVCEKMRCVGTAESALTRVYTRSCSGKLFCWSESWNELRQLKPKILIGVSNDAVVARWLRRTCELSITPRLSAYL